MTSLLNNQVNTSQKKLLETFSVHRTKTLKKNENLNFENTLNLNARTKHGQRKNEEKKQIISTFQITKEVSSGSQTKDNKFSNIDILKDSTYFGNKSFLDKLNSLGFEGVEQLESSLNKNNKSSSLKRVKTSPNQQALRVDPPENFFGELTPDLFQSRVMPNNQNINLSIRDNESMMYFFDIKQPSVNKSIVYQKNISSQILSPSRAYDSQRPALFHQKNNMKFDQSEIDMMNIKNHLQFYDKDEKLRISNIMKKSPANSFWNKNMTSPLKDFNVKSTTFPNIFLTVRSSFEF